MQEKDKKGNGHLSDFLRYHGNKMTDRERNAFERHLQKDPFAEEASEGYNETGPFLAEKDISELRKRLIKRTSDKKKKLWYRIAASVAALMVLSILMIVEESRRPSEEMAQTPEPLTEKESPVLQEQRPENAGINNQVPAVSDKSEKVKNEPRKSEGVSIKKEEFTKEEALAENQQAIIMAEAKEPEQVIVAEKDKVMVPVSSGRITKTSVPITGNIIPAEDTSLENKLDPSVSALSETVVVGYSVKGAGEHREDTLKAYRPPSPQNGKNDFDKYIRDNIHRPDRSEGQRVVVVLDFIVTRTGKTDSIKVVRSPGKIFSDEAIRLIREGPSWNPAEKDGEPISDEVRIRIVFK
jgi:TonB family protein